MKAKKYRQHYDGGWMPFVKAFKTQCCDCGLVHQWIFEKHGRELGFIISRDNRATAQIRRRK
jgi:hypothetical protein